jgi:hypothetical protein
MTKRMTTTTAIRDVLERSGAIDDAPRRRQPAALRALARAVPHRHRTRSQRTAMRRVR